MYIFFAVSDTAINMSRTYDLPFATSDVLLLSYTYEKIPAYFRIWMSMSGICERNVM